MTLRLLAIAFCVVSVGGCGSTIVTRIHSRDVVFGFPIPRSEKQARRLEKQFKIVGAKPAEREASVQALVRWAGVDSERLALAAEALLQARVTGPEEVSGYSLIAMEMAWRSLRASGVPPSKWPEKPATRRTVAIYNAALDRFVSLHRIDLARGEEPRVLDSARCD